MTRQMQACAQACPRADVHRGTQACKAKAAIRILGFSRTYSRYRTSSGARGDDVSQEQHTLPVYIWRFLMCVCVCVRVYVFIPPQIHD